MMSVTETEIVQACRTIFGKNINISRDFLYYMQPSGARSAYRKRAKENHPDLFTNDPVHVQQKQTALFRDILHAYDTITLFFKQRDQGACDRSPHVHQTRPKPENGKPAHHKTSAGRKTNNAYYSGMIPNRILQIGQYLYYRGKISFGSMIDAVVWQRKQRPSIGEIAVQWGLLEAADLGTIMKACDRPRFFGEKAVELGLLTTFQVNTILLYQRSQQMRLGDYFVQHTIVATEEMEQLVQDLTEHNAAVLASRVGSRQRQHVHA
jgi:hypothetical protein